MSFRDLVLVAVIGGVIVAAIVGTSRWTWTNRSAPLDWAAAGADAIRRRKRRISRANHAELVKFVLQRAEVLQLGPGEDLPVRVAGSFPAVVTFHPTGRTSALYPDVSSYQMAAQSGEASPTRAAWGRPPAVVSDWDDDRLRLWLADHADEMPPGSAREGS